MNEGAFWQYSEFKQAGADFVNEKRAAAYDEMMDKISSQKERAKEMIVLHIKEEFSTFDWLMDEMLKRTGFDIVKKVIRSTTIIDYVCKKLKK